MARRKLTRARLALYAVLTPIGKFLIRFWWSTCRIVSIEGEEHLKPFLDANKPVIFCYWHGLQLFSAYFLFNLPKRGMPLGFLISPSVDGEIPARIARDWGAETVRASTTRSGAKALRDIFLLMKKGVSPVTASDGPKGPEFEFKPGAILMAQYTRRPMVPLSFAARPYCRLRTWDRFLLPLPFARIAIVIGEPVYVETKLDDAALKDLQSEMAQRMKALYLKAKKALPVKRRRPSQLS